LGAPTLLCLFLEELVVNLESRTAIYYFGVTGLLTYWFRVFGETLATAVRRYHQIFCWCLIKICCYF